MPLLKCVVCGQGAHTPCLLQLSEVSPDQQDSFGPEQVQNKINPHNIPGIFYDCHSCEKERIPSKNGGRKKGNPNRSETVNLTDVRGEANSLGLVGTLVEFASDAGNSEQRHQVNGAGQGVVELIHSHRQPRQQDNQKVSLPVIQTQIICTTNRVNQRGQSLQQ